MKKTLSIEAIHPLYAMELGVAVSQIDNIAEKIKVQGDMGDEGDGDGCLPQEDLPYQIIDGIAIYKISGPLLTTGTWWSKYLGYAAYDGIREDLLKAANDPNVTEILMVMATPGGSAFGVTDAAEAITKVNAVKPITVFSQQRVASGGYWLASNAGTLIGSPESEWGSIGVIVTHFSYEKQLNDEGITATVIRSDELKAVGGPYKDLTDAEVKHIQDQVNQIDDLFKEQIKTKRPGVKLSSMKGQTFIGAEAVRMGLVDAVMSYDQTIEYIKSKRQTTKPQFGGYNMKMTAVELKAALEAGKTLADLGLTEEEAAEISKGVQEPEVPTTPEVPAEIQTLTTQVEELTASLSAKDAEIAALKLSIEQMELDKGCLDQMKTIICDVMNNRRIALQLPKIDFSGFSASSIMTDYKAITEQYDKAFVTGGIFAKKQEEAQPQVVIDSVHAAKLNATA